MSDHVKWMTSSSCPDWITPTWVYNALNDEFNFDHDPCPEQPTSDGLTSEWGQRNFVNPPYTKTKDGVENWLRKGIEESLKGKTCVFLLSVRTSTYYFHKLIRKYAAEIRWIHGRLNFLHPDAVYPLKGSNYFGSSIIVFKPHKKKRLCKSWSKRVAARTSLRKRGQEITPDAIQKMISWFDSFDDRPHRKEQHKQYKKNLLAGMPRKQMDAENFYTMGKAAFFAQRKLAMQAGKPLDRTTPIEVQLLAYLETARAAREAKKKKKK